MNRYSLSSDSDRWWCPAAIAGVFSAAAVSAILVVPLIGAQATPVGTPPDDAAPPVVTESVRVDRPCYLARRGWNTPAGWEQPVCSTTIRRGTVPPSVGVRRVAPDYLP